MSTATVRYALISSIVTLGLLVGSAATASAAPKVAKAAVAFGTSGPSAAAVTSAHPCQSGQETCVSSDPKVALSWSSSASTSGCGFGLVVNWGDGKPAQTIELGGSKNAKVWTIRHNYPGGVAARQSYPITAKATVLRDKDERGCSIASGATTLVLTCTATQLSGTSWNTRFPGGLSALELLNDGFRPRVEQFATAMSEAGITVRPTSTLRSPQRSYLMHFSYKIAKGQISPADVPAYVPVGKESGPKICWQHRTATGKKDAKASVAAAKSLLGALGVDSTLATPPALRSRHNTGDAIDMSVSWTQPTIKIKNAEGRLVRIGSGPKDGTNPKLMAVGASYGVNHYMPAAVDRNHWSSDGR
ncbi:hypothetical protein [Kineosporia babensis]|uniref:Uncharacterized protein n=1 Tax=Kineosporia babensis TaxID=499548 RepID=A0A9X1NBX4_9ACTN|nr:hypothetical protein [Kineosporia babensis]MCD5311009.1 hypothetical protein [Kineosporia babensis]